MDFETGQYKKAIVRFSVLAMLLLSAPLFQSVYAQTPSFDCSKAAQPIEHLICGSTELSAIDAELGAAFKWALDVSGERRTELLASQRQWIRRRAAACPVTDKTAPGPDLDAARECIIDIYRSRIADLTIAKPASGDAVACESDEAKLTEAELSRFKAVVAGLPGRPDFHEFVDGDGSVFFVCRDRRHEPDNFLFRDPTVCTACGDIYSVHQENATDVLSQGRVGGNSDGNGVQIFYDNAGHPFVVVSGDYAAHGVAAVTYEMIGLDDGKVTPLASASSSMSEECDAKGPQVEEDLKGPEKILRKDGRYDIVFRLSHTSCETKQTTVKILRFVSTDNGFKKQ